MENNTNQSLVGRKMRGFRFEPINESDLFIPYNRYMDNFIGIEGEIIVDHPNELIVVFPGNTTHWYYPKSIAIEHLVPETVEMCGSDCCPDDGRCEHCKEPVLKSGTPEIPNTSKPLSLQEAKNAICIKLGVYGTDYTFTPAMWEDIAELYCQSQLSSKEERIRELEEQLKAAEEGKIEFAKWVSRTYDFNKRFGTWLENNFTTETNIVNNERLLKEFYESLKQPPTA